VESTAENAATQHSLRPMHGKHSYQRLLHNQYLIHNLIVLVGTVTAGLLNYILNPVLTHLIGLASYSQVVSLLGLLAIILTPTQVIGTIVVRATSTLAANGDAPKIKDLFLRLTRILLPVGVLSAIIFASFSNAITSFLHLKSTVDVFIVSVALVLAFIGPIAGGTIQGSQRFIWFSFSAIATPLFRLVLVGIMIYLGFGLEGALIGIVLAAAVVYFATLIPLRHLLSGRREDSGSLRPLVSYSVTASVALVSTVLLLNTDTVLAGHFFHARTAGIYDGLAVIGRLVLYFSASVSAVMFPRIAALHDRGEHATTVAFQALLGVFALSLMAEIVFVVAAPLIVTVLFHTSAVLVVSNQLAWYGLAMLMFALAQALITYFLSVNDRLFVVSALAAWVLQAALIVERHDSIAEFVQAMVIANGVLLLGLGIQFAVFVRREARSGHMAAPPIEPVATG